MKRQLEPPRESRRPVSLSHETLHLGDGAPRRIKIGTGLSIWNCTPDQELPKLIPLNVRFQLLKQTLETRKLRSAIVRFVPEVTAEELLIF